jgi:hypothetical protein
VLHAHLGHQRLGAEVKNNLHASEGRHPPVRPTPDIPSVMVTHLHGFCDQDLLVKEACVSLKFRIKGLRKAARLTTVAVFLTE